MQSENLGSSARAGDLSAGGLEHATNVILLGFSKALELWRSILSIGGATEAGRQSEHPASGGDDRLL